jgi:hypothetical protein
MGTESTAVSNGTESAIFSACREVTVLDVTETTRESVTETTQPTKCDRNNACKTLVVSARLGTALYTVEEKTPTTKQLHRNNAHRFIGAVGGE